MSSESTVLQKQTIQGSNTYEELLRVKDEINSKLLEETKMSADLAHAQSFVEEQLRDGFEACLRNIRKEFVKRRKKFVPGVKQLEIASASICKAERTFQQFPRSSNSNIKKCKRRITAARHVLMECTQTPELFSNIQRCVNDEITFLREKLLTIPDSVCKHLTRLRAKQIDTDKPSDSDSDISIDDECISSKQISITSQHTKEHRFSSNRPIETLTKRPCKQEISKIAGFKNKSSTLNGVDLFTSDSDSLDDSIDTGSYPAMVPFESTLTTDQFDPTCLAGTRTPDIDVDMGSSGHIQYPNKCLEIPSHMTSNGVDETRGRTGQNMREDEWAMSGRRSEIFSRISRRDQNDSKPSPRASQKRFLPTLPTRSDLDKEPLFSKRSLEHKTTDEYLVDNDRLIENAHVKTTAGRSSVEKSLDIDEIEFKKTVKNTTQQIIDKLKSKCTINQPHEYLTSTMDLDDTATLLAPCSSIFSESMDSTLISIKNSRVDFKKPSLKHEGLIKTYNASAGHYRPIQTMIGHTSNGMENSKKLESVYNSKRVEVFKRPEKFDAKKPTETVSSQLSTQDSKVSIAIQKFEKVCCSPKAETPRHFRSLSASGPRMKYEHSFTSSNKALQPRTTSIDPTMINNTSTCLTNYTNRSTNEITTVNASFDTQTNESSFSTITRQTTGSNLEQICSRESRKAIRETWRNRRSHSMNPRVPTAAVKTGPTFDFVECFKLPSHGSKCRVSGIIVLSNGHVVALDEIHCYVVLFDSNLRYLSQHNILDVPSGITGTCDTSFAVSYPFRSKFGVFKEDNDVSVHLKDIPVPCKDWLTDIKFSKNAFYALCKGGHIHIIDQTGAETKRLDVEVNGKLLINEAAKRIYVISADRITRFDSEGNQLSRKTGIHAVSAILIGEMLYVGDRNKHKIVPLSENTNTNDLTVENVKFPFAITRYQELLIVSCFEESLTVEDTRTIKVFRLRK